ncbi:hypothetical protein Tco_0604805 [Tanacetum coccineum]
MSKIARPLAGGCSGLGIHHPLWFKTMLDMYRDGGSGGVVMRSGGDECVDVACAPSKAAPLQRVVILLVKCDAEE